MLKSMTKATVPGKVIQFTADYPHYYDVVWSEVPRRSRRDPWNEPREVTPEITVLAWVWDDGGADLINEVEG